MKKLIALILALAMAVSFASCERKEPGTTDIEIPEGADLIPMVMVEGEIYLSTGEISEDGRCGLPDGEIKTSVPQNEEPKQNDESNFGKGYSYQIMPEGEVHLLINDKWEIFKKEMPSNTVAGLDENYEFTAPHEIKEEDADILRNIISSHPWNENTTECFPDAIIILDDVELFYHSDCGSLNAGTMGENGSYIKLEGEAKTEFEEVLERYIKLGKQE